MDSCRHCCLRWADHLGAGLGYAGNVYGNPRTFGLQLIYNFAES